MIIYIFRGRQHRAPRWRDLALDGRLCFEAILLHFGRRALDADGRRLQLEGLGCGGRCTHLGVQRSVLHALFDVGGLGVVVDGWAPATVAGGEGTAGGVGCGLRAQLGEVEVGAGFVAGGHGLAELVFGVEAVEDDGVDGNGDDFDDDFDDGAEEGPVLGIRVREMLKRRVHRERIT